MPGDKVPWPEQLAIVRRKGAEHRRAGGIRACPYRGHPGRGVQGQRIRAWYAGWDEADKQARASGHPPPS